MANERQKVSINQLVHDTSYELAKKELNFKETDKQDQKKLAILQQKMTTKSEEVTETINSMYNTLTQQYNIKTLPDGMMQECAQNVFEQVIQNGLTYTSEINIGEDVLTEILNSALGSTVIVQKETLKESIKDMSVIDELAKSFKDNSEKEKLKNQIDPEVFSRAHRKDATDDDKTFAAVMMCLTELDTFMQLGLKFGELDSFDQSSIIVSVNTLMKNNQTELAQNYIKAFGLNEEILKDPKYSNVSYSLGTNSAEMDETARKIHLISDKIKIFITYQDRLSPDKKALVFSEIEDEIKKSNFPIDGILEGFANNGSLKTEDPYQMKLIEMLKDKLKEKDSDFLVDGYATINFMIVGKLLSEQDPDLADDIIQLFNTHTSQKDTKITLDMLKQMDYDDFYNVSSHVQSEELEKEGTSFVTKEALKNLFDRKITSKTEVNENMIKYFAEIDYNALKSVLKEDLINRPNSSKDMVLGAYIEKIGDVVKEGAKEKIFDASKTDLAEVSKDGAKIIQKKDDRSQEGWEH